MSASATKTVHGASACLVDHEGRVLLIAREKEPFRDALAFPGGSIEAGETALEAARRELFEETGFRAQGDPFAQVVIENVHGATRFRIDAFAFAAFSEPENESENETSWHTFTEALGEKLAPGMEIALAEFQRAFSARK